MFCLITKSFLMIILKMSFLVRCVALFTEIIPKSPILNKELLLQRYKHKLTKER